MSTAAISVATAAGLNQYMVTLAREEHAAGKTQPPRLDVLYGTTRKVGNHALPEQTSWALHGRRGGVGRRVAIPALTARILVFPDVW
jgi:hypothetical protein